MKCTHCGTGFNGNFCPNCGAMAAKLSEEQHTQQETDFSSDPVQVAKTKKPIFKRAWFWIIIIVAAIGCISGLGNKNDSSIPVNDAVKVTISDFSTMDQAAIQSWADTNKVNCTFSEEYSDLVEKGAVISQSTQAGETVNEGSKISIVISLGKKPSVEYLNALAKAEIYSETMHMSKIAIYDQLTSQYGEKFPDDAAQYAIDNLKADWNANALAKAETYSETMSMSKAAIYDQLTSEYGEKFTDAEAQYAIDNLEADWNANALEKAKLYSETMSMSRAAIYDQLISKYGEKFTKEEAQYAIDHLDA